MLVKSSLVDTLSTIRKASHSLKLCKTGLVCLTSFSIIGLGLLTLANNYLAVSAAQGDLKAITRVQMARQMALEMTANNNYLDKQIIIQTKPETRVEAIQQKLHLAEVALVKTESNYNTYLVTLPQPTKLRPTLEVLLQEPSVTLAQPIYQYHTFQNSGHIPNDPLFNTQWQFDTPAPGINLPQAWSLYGTHKNLPNCNDGNCGGSSEVKIAVIDTGINTTVSDLAGANWAPQADWRSYYWANQQSDCTNNGHNVESDWPISGVICVANGNQADQHGHGTSVASVLAMQHNTIGGAGIVPKVQILPIELRDCQRDAQGQCINGYSALNTFTIERAIDYARSKGVKIINLSLGSDSPDAYVKQAIDRFNQEGGIVVAAAGNGALDGNPKFYPAYEDNTIAVGAITRSNSRASYSTYHDRIDIAAPVDDLNDTNHVLVQTHQGDFMRRLGTSFAAPQVVGVIALMVSINPEITFFDLKYNFLPNGKMTVDIGPSGKDNETGYGRLDAFKAVQSAIEVTNVTCFSDVWFNHPFNETICALKRDQIVRGYSDKTYRPSNSVTRGEMSAFIKRATGLPTNTSCQPFPDVTSGAPFFEEITTLKCQGIVQGYPQSNGTFLYKPNNFVTRGEMAKFIKLAFNIPTNTTCGGFPDVPAGAPFYEEITSLKCANIIRGYPEPNGSRTYRPQNNVSRGEMSVFIDKARKYPNI